MKTQKVDQVTVVELGYDHLDANNISRFKQDIDSVLKGETKVVLDLSGLEFSDSSGLGAFLSCLRRVKGNGGDLKLCGMSSAVRALFELVRMHRVIEICNTRDEAIRSMA